MLEQQERDMQDKIESAERERTMRDKQQEQELRLAKEMEKLKWEEQRDKRRKQQLKENRSVVVQDATHPYTVLLEVALGTS